MKYFPGAIVEGLVTGIKPYGAFVDIEGNAGLIHISEITSGYVNDVYRFLSIGDKVTVKILDVDPKNKHYQLSLKALNQKRLYWHRRQLVFGGIPQFTLGFKTVAEQLPHWLAAINKGVKDD